MKKKNEKKKQIFKFKSTQKRNEYSTKWMQSKNNAIKIGEIHNLIITWVLFW